MSDLTLSDFAPGDRVSWLPSNLNNWTNRDGCVHQVSDLYVYVWFDEDDPLSATIPEALCLPVELVKLAPQPAPAEGGLR